MPTTRTTAELVEPEELRRSRTLFYWYTYLLAGAVLAYGILDVLTDFDIMIGWEEIGFGAALLINTLAYRRHKDLLVAKVVFATLILGILALILPSGGQSGGAAYWLILFPIIMFMMLGVRVALVINAVELLMTFLFVVAQRYHVVDTVYSVANFQQIWVVMVVANILGLAVETGQRRFRDTILAQRERLRVLLGSLPAGVIMVDADGRPTDWNDSSGILLGRPVTEEFRSARFAESFALRREAGAPYDSAALPLEIALRAGRSSMVNDVFVRRPTGTDSVLRFAGAPVHDVAGKLRGAVVVFEDATREHDVDRMKSEFVSFASHQLKTPLTGIKWAVETLMGGSVGELTPQQKTFVGRIQETAENLTKLVLDLLDVSRIESGRNFAVEKAPVDLRPLLDAVVAELAPAATRKGVTVSADGLGASVPRVADAAKLREVFLNLVGNAIKYSKPGGHVTLGLAQTGQGEAVTVSDEGIGIPAAQQSRVFDRFFRAENATGVEGTGLGLYIVRAVIVMHGGAIWFESKEGLGTTFFVVIPKA